MTSLMLQLTTHALDVLHLRNWSAVQPGFNTSFFQKVG